MCTRWIVVSAAILILAGCGQKSRVDEVVDQDRDQIPAVVATTSATPAATTATPTAPTTTAPKAVVTSKPAVKAKPKAKPKPKKTTKAPEPVDVYYANCAAVRAADADPIRVGDPGYSRKLDRDGDGVGCE